MVIQFNRTIVRASDGARFARFLADMLGLPAPIRFGPFEVAQTQNGVSLVDRRASFAAYRSSVALASASLRPS